MGCITKRYRRDSFGNPILSLPRRYTIQSQTAHDYAKKLRQDDPNIAYIRTQRIDHSHHFSIAYVHNHVNTFTHRARDAYRMKEDIEEILSALDERNVRKIDGAITLETHAKTQHIIYQFIPNIRSPKTGFSRRIQSVNDWIAEVQTARHAVVHYHELDYAVHADATSGISHYQIAFPREILNPLKTVMKGIPFHKLTTH